MRSPGPRFRLGLLAAGLTMLVGAWLMSNLPFSAPDEPSQVFRALNISNGVLLGKKAHYTQSVLTPEQRHFIDYDTRLVRVPRALQPAIAGCVTRLPHNTAAGPSCYEFSVVGNFPPVPYLLPALALKISHQQNTAIWLTRLGSALPSLAFLLLALALLWDGTGLSSLGLLAAMTPMVMFCSSIMNSSGPAIGSAMALAAAGLRLARAPTQAPRWVFISLAVAGFVAIVSGPIGLVFAAADLILALLLLRWSGIVALWRERRRDVIGTVGVLAVAAVIALIWRKVSGGAPGLFGIHPLLHNLHGGLDQMPAVMQDAIGKFGALTVVMPMSAYRLAWVFEGALLAAGLIFAAMRDRLVLALCGLLCCAFPIVFWAFIDRLTGFGLEGREILPILTLVPMAAGEMIYRSRSRSLLTGDAARWVLGIVFALIAVYQGYAWWFNARANAGAPGTLRFYAHATWSPPAGWGLWIGLAIAAILALLAFAATELPLGSLSRRRAEPAPT